MTSEQLSAIAGVLLSLIFSYVPQARAWFNQYNTEQKRLVMLVLILVTAAGAFGLSCAGQASYFVCSQPGVWDALRVVAAAAVANQVTYKLSPSVGQ